MGTLDAVKNKTIETVLMKGTDMLMDDPDKNLPRILGLVKTLKGFGDSTSDHQLELALKIGALLEDPDNNWRKLIDKIRGLDRDLVKLFVKNFFVNSVIIGGNRQLVVIAVAVLGDGVAEEGQ